MAKSRKKPLPKPKAPRPPVAAYAPPAPTRWKRLLFSDLHVAEPTLERCCGVLAEARQRSIEHKVDELVFLGDFWDLRGVHSVRQVDALLDSFFRIHELGILFTLIPGNHDQVSLNGLIHGIRLFSPFPNVRVATHPIINTDERIAYLPWRENPAEQAALFEQLEGTGWTIFGHAEVSGAQDNYGHQAPGRVTIGQIEAKARACYLGHYHLRQKLGTRTWYIGNPYEKHFGEMGQPKGLALVTSEETDPTFIELDMMPRHHRIFVGDAFDPKKVKGNDIVEVYASPQALQQTEAQDFIDKIRLHVADVRPIALAVKDDIVLPPTFALTLDQAVTRFVEEMADEASRHGADLGVETESAIQYGRSILAALPEAKMVTPVSPLVRPLSIEVRNFCAVKGVVTLTLSNQGLVLLKGQVGIGKTALVDALSWCLYGETSPRKAGAHGATFRGDEVVNDDADEARVRTHLWTEFGEVFITRAKRRGKGAVIEVAGGPELSGISDTQDIINRIIGLDYDRWRTCVSLGQGAVGNFVTDPDKKRKDLLSAAFGLNACPLALKSVRDRLKPYLLKQSQLRTDVASEQRAYEVLKTVDYESQAKLWDEQREARKSAAVEAGTEAKNVVAECDSKLAQEAQWLAAKEQYDTHVNQLTKALGQGPAGRVAELEREFGAARAERAVLEAQWGKLKLEYESLSEQYASNPSMPCPTCNQPMPNVEAEKLVASKAHEIERLVRGMQTFDHRMANATAELQGLRHGTDTHRQTIEAQLGEARSKAEQIGTALSALAQLKVNRADAARRLQDARRLWEVADKEANPFRAKAEQHAKQMQEVQDKLNHFLSVLTEVDKAIALLQFWEVGFGSKGIPVLVLRTALHELEAYANRFLATLLQGQLFCQLAMNDDALEIRWFETKGDKVRERRYEQLSGGQRRCAELAFVPFALSELIFARCGVRVPLLTVDELTTHLGTIQKAQVCELLRGLDRETVIVIDHDASVQAEFDTSYLVEAEPDGKVTLTRVS